MICSDVVKWEWKVCLPSLLAQFYSLRINITITVDQHCNLTWDFFSLPFWVGPLDPWVESVTFPPPSLSSSFYFVLFCWGSFFFPKKVNGNSTSESIFELTLRFVLTPGSGLVSEKGSLWEFNLHAAEHLREEHWKMTDKGERERPSMEEHQARGEGFQLSLAAGGASKSQQIQMLENQPAEPCPNSMQIQGKS